MPLQQQQHPPPFMINDDWVDEDELARRSHTSKPYTAAESGMDEEERAFEVANERNETPSYSISELVASLGNDNDSNQLPPALERRIRDFRFAQQKRREKYGDDKPWGILGLYVHLSDIRIDLEWAEDAAWRRQHGEPYLSWADFENVRDKGFNRPFFTYLMLVVCTVMLLVSIGVNGWKIEPIKVNPLIGPSAQTLVDLGARQTSLIVNEGQWYRIFTPMFLHAGIIHYIINMLALWFIGGAVEQSHGFTSASILFVIPAVGGNILSAIFLPQFISVGASGGIFGLIGACLADIFLNWNLLFLKSDEDKRTRSHHAIVIAWLFVDIVVNLLIGFTPFVDNFTHLGGGMYGVLCGFSTMERLGMGFFGVATGKCSKLRNNLVKFFGLIVSVVLIMVTTLVLANSNGRTSPCPKCRYISCIPFPPGDHEKWWHCDDCDSVSADVYKESSDSAYFNSLDLTCPNGQVVSVNIAADQIADSNVIQRKLPTYCRKHCAEKFNNSR